MKMVIAPRQAPVPAFSHPHGAFFLPYIQLISFSCSLHLVPLLCISRKSVSQSLSLSVFSVILPTSKIVEGFTGLVCPNELSIYIDLMGLCVFFL